jgi:cell division initiation protein
MKFTPLDIRQKRFDTSFRGYAARDVQGFLELLAVEFEELVKQNIALKEELKRTQVELDRHLERERALQQTLVTAQRVSEDLRDAAKKEAEVVIAEAELQSEKIVHAAHQKLVQVVDDINELKRQRARFDSELRGLVATHLKLLEVMTPLDAEAPVRVDDNVAFLAPKKTGSP